MQTVSVRGKRPRPLVVGHRVKLLLVGQALVIALAVWLASAVQRDDAAELRLQDRAARQMLTAVLDRSDALDTYLRSGEEQDLDPYVAAGNRYDGALQVAMAAVSAGDGEGLRAVTATARTDEALRDAGSALIVARQEAGDDDPLQPDAAYDEALGAFRTAQGAYAARLEARLAGELSRFTTSLIAVAVALGVGFAALAYVTVERWGRGVRRRQEAIERRERARTALRERLQLAGSEDEGFASLKNHIEARVRGARVTIVHSPSSERAPRLDGSRHEPAEAPPLEGLAQALTDPPSATCLSLRLGRAHARGAADDGDGDGDGPLCQRCGHLSGHSFCLPVVLEGEIAGSVLVATDRPLTPEERAEVLDTIALAAPALARLRSLTLAELRAATDALTGLPNNRAVWDNLRRMAALASRGQRTLTAMVLDLDHFKALNDEFGHRLGDEALAGVARVLRTSLRSSDFAGRLGGEEFVVLLPDTDRESSLDVAEHLRERIEETRLADVNRPVTASIGVAVLPHDARDAEGVLRAADQALYAAKDAGRNCVRSAVVVDGAV